MKRPKILPAFSVDEYNLAKKLLATKVAFMHPAATRSIRIPAIEDDPNVVMKDVLQQYADLIEQRREKVISTSPESKFSHASSCVYRGIFWCK